MGARTTVLCAVLAGLALAGCSGARPYEYRSDLELNERPGMFSGKKGAFVLTVAEQAAEDAPPPMGEYEDFQRWRGNAGASERREFEDWRQWREWKRREGK